MTTKSRPVALERAQVDVQVELEAQPQQQAPLEHAGRHLGRADRAEQDGVEAAQLVEHAVGQHLAGAEVAGSAEVELGGVEVDAGGAHDLEGLGHDLGADAVSADDRDLVAHASFPWNEKAAPEGTAGKRTPGRRALRNDDDVLGNQAGHPHQSPQRVGSRQPAAVALTAMSDVHVLSRSAYERLQAEHEDLTTRGRIEIAQAIEEARELGDLSENGDYHAAKDQQGKMEARIRQLERHPEERRDRRPGRSRDGGTGTIVTILYEGDDETTPSATWSATSRSATTSST